MISTKLPKLYIADASGLMHPFVIQKNLHRVSEFRQDKIKKYRFIRDQALSFGTELLLLDGLQQMGCRLNHISSHIRYNDFGKPYLIDRNIYFNFSHSYQFILGIFACSEVGCDIERMKEPDSDIVNAFFGPFEQDLYMNAPSNKKTEIFYQVWTMRESFLKTIGCGLIDPVPIFSTVSDDGLYVPVLTYKNRVFWGQHGIFHDYAYAWWSEV